MSKLFSVTLCICLLAVNMAGAQDKKKELDSIVTHWKDLAKFNGTVLVAQHGTNILYKGYGVRAVDQGNIEPVTTLYSIGGCTEMFTAGIIFRLQEEKKLSIEDSVSKYLPDMPHAKELKIKHLLSHQSGLYDYMTDDSLYSLNVIVPQKRETILSMFRDKPLAFKPGTGFLPSTTDYYLLGMIIEQATDTSYYAAMRKYILNPLKIENSGFNFAGFASWDKAQGYSILNFHRFIPAFPADSTISFAAASLFTSADGMYKWSKAFLDKNLLSKKSWNTMTTEQGNGYGYGWELSFINDKLSVGHSGETYGFVTVLNIIPEDSTIILIMSNDFESDVYSIRDELAAALYDKPYKLPRKREPVFLDAFKLGQYEGRYELPNGANINVYAKDKLLWGKIDGQPEFTMLADLEPDVFFLSSADVEFRFIREKGTNLVTDVIIYQNRKETKAHKWQ